MCYVSRWALGYACSGETVISGPHLDEIENRLLSVNEIYFFGYLATPLYWDKLPETKVCQLS